ncbi:hypothetical protein [Enterococcus sp. DIV0800]|uniref:hypothetical protein n=1 Tax=unclassified Enterococcus TaxID=2608891 RepID=UPI003D30120A
MKQEDIKFLKDLQMELNTQDKLCQADPRFWVIRDYKIVEAPDDYAEEYRVYDLDWNEYTIKEFLKYLKDNIGDYEYLEEDYDLDYDDYWHVKDIVDAIADEEKVNDWTVLGVREEAFNVQNTMFLTNREAKEHLKSNSHHYTKDAHTYAMTAWRSPQVERLINILQTADFS